MKQIYWTVIAIFISIGTTRAQVATEENVPISLLYSGKGTIAISHLSEEIADGLEDLRLHLFLPFNASGKQTLSVDASIQQRSILSDSKLQSNFGLSWQMHITRNFTLFSDAKLRYGSYGINNMLDALMYSDPLSTPQNFAQIGAGATVGVLHKYFWLATMYSHDFQQIALKKNTIYLTKNLFVTGGLRYITKNWEFKIPVELENTIEFSAEQLYFGSYVAYKHNYLSFKTNTLWNLDFELGVMPYHWLSIGIVYQMHQQSTSSTYGTTGSYLWKPKKLSL